MSEPIDELSTEQEEMVTGGFRRQPGFFFQDTAIETFGENQTNLETGAGNQFSSLSRTGYRFRQTTFAFFGDFSSLSRLFSLFRRFF
ncbi:hypothetical protein [Leptolyngbya sp. NIES-2104]|uniref:hypothetical protein n=1 Tax=Leptolyngbya sp. NIES-2104 TaxID=1552121 RepID=UPI0006ECB1A6|nr:hypothetical protein [Leptolyngbya sp. NIES-2104]GAP98888.1 hypothetical protein NIES2104_54440 [Leptolyngbya sp. NIES-2104]